MYIETTIPSYLTAKSSREIILLARQEITKEWWRKQRHEHEVYISDLVLMEAGGGDKSAADKRLEILRGIPVLETTEEAKHIAKQLLFTGSIPAKAEIDAFHLGLAVVHEMDVVLTWNCVHLANAATMRAMAKTINLLGYECPVLCTPMELMGGERT